MYRIGGRLGSPGVSSSGVAGGIPLLDCWISNLRPGIRSGDTVRGAV